MLVTVELIFALLAEGKLAKARWSLVCASEVPDEGLL
jgi:hypothetical protein